MPKTIFEAAGSNDVSTIQHLLRANVSSNKKFFPINGRTYIVRPLANIAYYGNKIITWSLATFFAFSGVAAAPETGVFGLIFAGGSLSLAKYINDEGDKLLVEYTFDCRFWTPLHFAAVSNSISAAVCLIIAGADVGMEDFEKKRTFLNIAKEMKHTEFCEICTLIVDFREKYLKGLNSLEAHVNSTLQELLRVEQAMADAERILGVAQANASRQEREADRNFFNNFMTFFSGSIEGKLAFNIATLNQRLTAHRRSAGTLTNKIREFAGEAAQYKTELRQTLAENIQLNEYRGILKDRIERLEETMQPRLLTHPRVQTRRCTIV